MSFMKDESFTLQTFGGYVNQPAERGRRGCSIALEEGKLLLLDS